ncbi:hypothetical protein ACI703_10615 [Isoptericola jiangsuensis]|uniref:hypothetical protein n=1 Tax=Isoptericola jiangsuensis TaxID=548579 RepID=UPI00386652B1
MLLLLLMMVLLLMVGADRWSALALTPVKASFNRRRFSGQWLQGPVAGILALARQQWAIVLCVDEAALVVAETGQQLRANAKGSDPFPAERAPTPLGSRGVRALPAGGI